MSYDGFFMKKAIKEVQRKVSGKLKNIYQIDSAVFYLDFQNGGIKISLEPNFSYLIYSEKDYKNASFPSSFTMHLRKILKNAKLLTIEQQGFSRIAQVTFEKYDEFGDKRLFTLVAEIMGKFSNLILLDENKTIIDVYRRISTSKGRNLFPGKKFIPYPSEKIDPYSEKVFEEFHDIGSNLEKLIISKVEGISRLIAREIIYRAKEITPEGLKEALKEILKEFESTDEVFIAYKNGEPIETSAIILKHLEIDMWKSHPPSEAVKLFHSYKKEKEFFLSKKNGLQMVVEKEIKRKRKLLEKLSEQLKECEDFEKYRKYGELLKANYFEIKPETSPAILWDWEDEKYIEVPLVNGKSPLESAIAYFETYKKKKKKYHGVKKRLEDLKDEIKYLESIITSIENSETLEDLLDVEEEMEATGLKTKKKRKLKNKSEVKLSSPRSTVYKGFKILIGKNNKQNERIVRESSPKDIWLHAKEIPGAHVIIKTAGKDISEDIIQYAASLAAGYSKGRHSTKVPVDYTLIKYVKKPKHSKPGMVIYTNYKTVYATPKRLDDF